MTVELLHHRGVPHLKATHGERGDLASMKMVHDGGSHQHAGTGHPRRVIVLWLAVAVMTTRRAVLPPSKPKMSAVQMTAGPRSNARKKEGSVSSLLLSPPSRTDSRRERERGSVPRLRLPLAEYKKC